MIKKKFNEKKDKLYFIPMILIHKSPLFLPAIYFLIGIFFNLYLFQMGLIAIFFIYWAYRHMPLLLLIFAFGVLFSYTQIVLPESTVSGPSHMKILKMEKGKWGGHILKGSVSMKDEKGKLIAKNILVSSYLKSIDSNAKSLFGKATLIQNEKRWKLQFEKGATIQENRTSFTPFIQRIKQMLNKRIASVFPSQKSAQFFKATFLGFPPSDSLYYQFKKTGLLHILAISGFHFGLICFSLHILCRKFFSTKTLGLIQILIMSVYFLLLDMSPSITRAYILIVIFYSGILFRKRSNLINSLSLAFFIEVLIHPTSILQMGMQLSYLITLSLLCFYPHVSKWFLKSIPKQLSFFDQHIAILLGLFYKALAIAICVNIISIPALLYHFHQAGLLSLIYNLFMPQLLSLCMMSALFTFLFPYLPKIVDFATKHILDLIEYIPQRLDFILHFQMPGMVVGCLFSILFFLFLRQEKMIHGPKSAHLLHSLS